MRREKREELTLAQLKNNRLTFMLPKELREEWLSKTCVKVSCKCK
jgi:hypothetical protein